MVSSMEANRVLYNVEDLKAPPQVCVCVCVYICHLSKDKCTRMHQEVCEESLLFLRYVYSV